jgi:hypothetical protein
MLSAISPEILASLPTTTLYLLLGPDAFFIRVAYAEVNLTISSGVNELPASPPIVPLIPDIDLISVMILVCYELDSIIK